MSKINPKTKTPAVRLAGGSGGIAARSTVEQQLRRMVLANLLFEDVAYIDGVSVAEQIKALIPQVEPDVVANIAIEARLEQKLRHVPLLLIREMARHATHKHLVRAIIPQVCTRADMLGDLLALYWKDGTHAIPKQLKLGLADAFHQFNEYQLSKYDRQGGVRLRDVLFQVHPKPANAEQDALWKALASNTLKPADTWEVALSSGADKKESWERLLREGKLGALAFLRNLRNMEEVGVDRGLILHGFKTIKSGMLLPLNFFAAAKHAPQYMREIDQMMIDCYANQPKLPGWTVFVDDVSGSMSTSISSRSDFSRIDAAAAMTTLAVGRCEQVTVYATAGNDMTRVHKTELLPTYQGFAMADAIRQAANRLGGGGIFTRQCLEHIEKDLKGRQPDRIIVFSDSQDCDRVKTAPKPFGKMNYIVDVSAHQHGINYKGVWTSEISGWSEKFIDYIAAMEGVQTLQEEDAA